MKAADRKYLRDLARMLDDANRLGEDEDGPEGVRYIQISDILARMIARQLRQIAGRKR